MTLQEAAAGWNVYTPRDAIGDARPEQVFISHRNADKPLANAVAQIFDDLGVHYWYDRDDEDTARAAALGLVGDQELVFAIDRGIRHSTRMLGLLSDETRGSWWVPYEIGAARALGRQACHVVLDSLRDEASLPEYVRIAANFWSVDELVRWTVMLGDGHLHAQPRGLSERSVTGLQVFLRRHPPEPDIAALSAQALSAMEQMVKPTVWEVLSLTSEDVFDWLPTNGGYVRDLAYDLLAPLAFLQLHREHDMGGATGLLSRSWDALTRHEDVAAIQPRLDYCPHVASWRRTRYIDQASGWLQGMSTQQLSSRVSRFLLAPRLDGGIRLATKEEFKLEFDRILRSGSQHDRRGLGVLINPLFGFTPTTRPVYLRILAIQAMCYGLLIDRDHSELFGSDTRDVVEKFLQSAP
ncbi:MAG: toll/interleukin-1 receptor domain-containing protein [Streptomyces sp.]|nr:toll/interleukin-1 receptor domain-containing protein [Streptomyces sp.]